MIQEKKIDFASQETRALINDVQALTKNADTIHSPDQREALISECAAIRQKLFVAQKKFQALKAEVSAGIDTVKVDTEVSEEAASDMYDLKDFEGPEI